MNRNDSDANKEVDDFFAYIRALNNEIAMGHYSEADVDAACKETEIMHAYITTLRDTEPLLRIK